MILNYWIIGEKFCWFTRFKGVGLGISYLGLVVVWSYGSINYTIYDPKKEELQ